MNYKIKLWLYIASSILVIGLIGYLAINLLVYLIPVIIFLYIIFKIKGYINKKKNNKSKTQYKAEYKSSKAEKVDEFDETSGEVIDVDYEDIDK